VPVTRVRSDTISLRPRRCRRDDRPLARPPAVPLTAPPTGREGVAHGARGRHPPGIGRL